MSASADWLEQLEARLEQQLEAFLRANPAQEALLQEQEQLEHRKQQRQALQQAEALRSELLHSAAEIQQWRDRAQRARSAGASALADRAEQQVLQLMERGRQRWQALEQLGRQVCDTTPAAGAARSDETRDAPQSSSAAAAGREPLDQAWARFETEQELEALRRRQGQGG
jgi:hercynine metabolism protein